MTRSEFIAELADAIGADPSELNEATVLESLEAWDSVAYLSTLVLIDDRLRLNLRPEQLRDAVTLGDIVKVVESRLEA